VFQTLDFDGDGLLDFISGTAVYRHSGNKADQLTSVLDGLGGETTITYKPVSDPSVYSATNDCAWPKNCLTHGQWVVSEYTTTADWDTNGKPTNPTRNGYQFFYTGGRSDLRGRGWLGFTTRTVTDEQTGAVTVTTYADPGNDTGAGYPMAGVPHQVQTTLDVSAPGSGTIVTQISTTTTTYNTPKGLQNRTAFAQPQSVHTLLSERRVVTSTGATSGASLLDSTTAYQYDAFNNVTKRTTTFSSGESLTFTAHYDQNQANGKNLLSLLRRTDDTSQTPAQGSTPPQSVTRTHLYSPDPNTGLLTNETIQPDGGPSLRVDVHYDRNSFGEVFHTIATAADPVTPSAQITRESFTTYDTIDSTFPASSYNVLGHTTRMVYHPGLGVLAFSQDPNGITTLAHYDGFGRPRDATTDGQGTTTVDYRPGHPYAEGPDNVPGLYTIEADQAGGGHTRVTYDASGHVIVRGARNHDGTNSYAEILYGTISGQVKQTLRPHPFGAALSSVPSSSFVYDHLGRVTQTTLPDGSSLQQLYNARATTEIDAKGFPRTRVNDELGRLVRVYEDSVPNAAFDPSAPPPTTAIATSYDFWPFGLLKQASVTRRGSGQTPTVLTAMQYDAVGRRLALQDADRGSSSTTYDAFGEVATQVDANGQTRIHSRDAIGRIFADYSTQDGSSFFQWDTASKGTGKLGSATSTDQVTTAYAYDAFSRLTDSVWTIQGDDFAVHRTLDAFGRLQVLNYPAVAGEQLSVQFGFDATGATSSATSLNASTPLTWSASTWEADGQLTAEAFGQGGQTQRGYDPARGWLKDITTTTPTGICFAAGTLVDTPNGEEPIESLKVGDRVRTSDDDGSGSTSVDPTTWRDIRLHMQNPDGSGDVLDVEVLRPVTWIAEVGAASGRWISFGLPEMGLYGPAEVETIAGVPPIQRGPGRVVRATVTHFNSHVHMLRFRETRENLEPTATHRLYSLDRQDWVPAAHLKVGERLWAEAGAVTLESNVEKVGTERVYNIEVETEHSYLVGSTKVLSHNVNPCAQPTALHHVFPQEFGPEFDEIFAVQESPSTITR
jgi:YD repeat-containing protein